MAKPRWEKVDWLILFGVAAVALLGLLPALASFGILDSSDGYYAEGAREMIQTGNYITPHLNYALFFDKPILDYWLIAASYKIFGVVEFAGRLPAVISAAGVTTFMYALSRQFLRRRAALLSCLVLAATPMWSVIGHMSLTDMPLSLFTWLSLGCFYLAIEKDIQWCLWVGYSATALGVLTKGPVAAVLVGATLALYLLATKHKVSQLPQLMKRLKVVPGSLLVLAISAPWFIAVDADTHGRFCKEFFWNHNINRALGNVDHKAGALYYLPFLLGGTFPWSFLLICQGPIWLRQALRTMKRSSDSSQIINAQTKFVLVSTIAATVTVAFFSALPSKLDTYILPAFPAIAMLCGITLDKLLRLHGNRAFTVFAAISAVVALLFVIIIAGTFNHSFPTFLPATITAVLSSLATTTDASMRFLALCALSVLFSGAVCSACMQGKHPHFSIKSFVVATLITVIMAVPTGLILGYQYKCRDFQALVKETARMRIDPVLCGHRNPSAIFYLHRPVTFAFGESELTALAKSTAPGRYFLLRSTVVRQLGAAGVSLRTIKESGEWQIAQKI
jgi:4-amino-4-deoxy-L-arabinose transferase-like glycosyltransferase